ncbi:DNA mismatch repair protein mutS [Magnaporthiopsis poae ATCC 64411]|uniref:DNA mismatch repair protein mutS n=1 Tax=Magnaporthiopsis poae (strain ATCC 64411 / 73-15) TaxID=644358 RepID=A0A0C4DMY1_MAGP6|nr:DNA mismatch repair protein mutS [Magnaporthiopsis poae ATCC 64411]
MLPWRSSSVARSRLHIVRSPPPLSAARSTAVALAPVGAPLGVTRQVGAVSKHSTRRGGHTCACSCGCHGSCSYPPRRTGHFGPARAAVNAHQQQWSRPTPSLGGTGGFVGSCQARGARTKTVVKLEDLPQGLVEVEPLPAEETGPAYPTVILQARRNMDRFDNCVLLTRVGGFYELYFEHAQEYGPLLNIKVASKKTGAGVVPMAGFPFFQLDRFLKILVQDLSRYVAIAEEFPNDASAKVKTGGLMHDRRVARIITPGTLIDEHFMDPYSNNYVMSIHLPDHRTTYSTDAATEAILAAGSATAHHPTGSAESAPAGGLAETALGLAWLDLSTGHFVTQTTTLASLSSVLSRVCPREVVLHRDVQTQSPSGLLTILVEDRHLVTYSDAPQAWTTADWAGMLDSDMPAQTRDSLTADEVAAGSLLLYYVKDRLQGTSMKLQPPVRHADMEVMAIDKNSMRSLEIRQTIRDGAFKGSLLHAVRRTVTKSGARLLNEWLSAPSTSLPVIESRQDLVSRFLQDEDLREGIVLLLRRCHDSQRLVQRFALGRGGPDDMLDLAKTIKATQDIVTLLQEARGGTAHAGIASDRRSRKSTQKEDCLTVVMNRFSLDKATALAKRIRGAIDEEGLIQRHQLEEDEAGQMVELAQQIVSEGGSEEDAAVLPKTAAAARKKRSLSIREYYSADNDAWIMKPRASRTLSRLHSELNGMLEEKVVLGETLQEQLGVPSLTLKWTPALGHICHVKGKDTRTLAADSGLAERGSSFTSNDCFVGSPGHGRLWLVTGPNMAGKSTFLRQNALITVLAQAGCFVPADHAELGVVDALFSRVGSADDLFRNQSTFMVEMLETAQILRCATPRSFVVMDEIGRGTTPEDGAAVSFACVDHLVRVNRCRALFATHFHKVADLAVERGMPVETYCTDVDEDAATGAFIFVHKLRKGINRRSHALKVARLAGLPDAAIKVAQDILDEAQVLTKF